jgi:predicted kinase
MDTSTILAFAGGLAGTAGSVITAVGANRTLSALRLAVDAHDLTLKLHLTNQRNQVLWDGLPKQNEKARAHDAKLVWSGISLLALGFILQALSAVFVPRCPCA